MRNVTEGINTVSSGSADVYLPCIVNLHSQREISLIMAAITVHGPGLLSARAQCLFYKWTGGGRRTQKKGGVLKHSDGKSRLIGIHASSNGPDRAL